MLQLRKNNLTFLRLKTINESRFRLKIQQNSELLQTKRTILEHSDFEFNVYDEMIFKLRRKMKHRRQ